MKDFEIRPYGKSELALLYCPNLTANGARRKLVLWIHIYPGLEEALERAGGLNDRARSYTPTQVRLIVEALGEP